MWRQKIISRSYIHTRLQSLSLFLLLLFLLCLSTSGCTIPPDVKPRLRHFFWSLLRPERRSVQGRKQKSTKKEEKQRKRRSARTNGKRREFWRACVSQEHRVLSHSPPHAVCSTSLRLSSPLPSRRFATSDSRFLHFLLFFSPHSFTFFLLSLFYVVDFFFSFFIFHVSVELQHRHKKCKGSKKVQKRKKKKKTHMRVCTLRRATTHGWHHCFRCSSHKIRTAPTTEIDECAFLLFRTTSRSSFPDDRVSICLCKSVYYSLCVCVCFIRRNCNAPPHPSLRAHFKNNTKKRNTLFFFSLLPCAVFYPHFIFVVCVFSLVFVVYVRQKKKKNGKRERRAQ